MFNWQGLSKINKNATYSWEFNPKDHETTGDDNGNTLSNIYKRFSGIRVVHSKTHPQIVYVTCRLIGLAILRINVSSSPQLKWMEFHGGPPQYARYVVYSALYGPHDCTVDRHKASGVQKKSACSVRSTVAPSHA